MEMFTICSVCLKTQELHADVCADCNDGGNPVTVEVEEILPQ